MQSVVMAEEKSALHIANIYYEFASYIIEIFTSVEGGSPEATNSTNLYVANSILNRSLQALQTTWF